MGNKYLEKIVFYEGVPVTLYSIDGTVWSSKKNELREIQERLLRKKLEILGVKTDSQKADDVSNPVITPVKDLKKKAAKVKDITKTIVDIKAEELRAKLIKNNLVELRAAKSSRGKKLSSSSHTPGGDKKKVLSKTIKVHKVIFNSKKANSKKKPVNARFTRKNIKTKGRR
ncbi:MAG: hypothetical protein N2654_00290 [Deltaproteobacteria bacterium]|nr:hypothetical protein [Deltaproteobacteria bacterium]